MHFGPSVLDDSISKTACGKCDYSRKTWRIHQHRVGALAGAQGVSAVLITGFYTHMCVSTSAREALVRGFEVSVNPRATGACDLIHSKLGEQYANEVHRTALLQIAAIGAETI